MTIHVQLVSGLSYLHRSVRELHGDRYRAVPERMTHQRRELAFAWLGNFERPTQ